MDPGEAPPLRHPRPCRPIRLTETLALHYFPQLHASPFVVMEVSESVAVDDPDGSFSVMAIDTNHCPGYHCSVATLLYLLAGEFSKERGRSNPSLLKHRSHDIWQE